MRGTTTAALFPHQPTKPNQQFQHNRFKVKALPSDRSLLNASAKESRTARDASKKNIEQRGTFSLNRHRLAPFAKWYSPSHHIPHYTQTTPNKERVPASKRNRSSWPTSRKTYLSAKALGSLHILDSETHLCLLKVGHLNTHRESLATLSSSFMNDWGLAIEERTDCNYLEIGLSLGYAFEGHSIGRD